VRCRSVGHGYQTHTNTAMFLVRRQYLPSTFALGLSVLLMAAATEMTLAQPSRWPRRDAVAQFDIPAQPLAQALDAYSAITGKEIFYDGAVGPGWRSVDVKGAFTPDDALNLLVSRTEFAVLPSGPGAYALIHAPDKSARAAAAARMTSDGQYARYFAIIQANVRAALCRTAETQPGAERLLFKFWIGPAGVIQRSELTEASRSQARNTALVETLKSLTFDEPPPADMPQPITMVVFPQKRAGSATCGRIDAIGAGH
jgi:hypothetical protein